MKIFHYIKELKWKLIAVFKKENTFNISLLKRIDAANHGFSPNEYYWFNLSENKYSDYISDHERVLSRHINPVQKIIFDDKILFEEIFRNYAKVPKNYGYINDGYVSNLHCSCINNDNIIDFVKEKKKVVFKLLVGAEGKGVYVVTHIKDNQFLVNKEYFSDIQLLNLIKSIKNGIVCEFVYQSDFSKNLYPYSSNTIRCICAKKAGGDNKARLLKAAYRIGNDISAPVDNVSAGAISCEIDIETGKLYSGVIAKRKTVDNDSKFFDNHPDTGARLSGLVVPNWVELKNKLEKITNDFPYINFVAWDVLLTNEGFCLIEGNASSGLVMFQQRHGVRNEEIGDIYRSYGIF